MVPKDCVCLVMALLCVVPPQALGGTIEIPKDADSSEPLSDTLEPDSSKTPTLTIETDQQSPESRGLWESDLFFLQKLSGLFGGGDERPKPSRQGGLRPEPLPPQLFFSPNRRVSPQLNRLKPKLKPIVSNSPPQNVPYFQFPFTDALALPSQKNVIAIKLPPPPPPPPSPPSSFVTISPIEPASRFPYQFVRPSGVTPPSPSKEIRPLVKTPSRVNAPPQPPITKPANTKPVKPKKPSFFGALPDLVGAFSITQKPQISLPARRNPQHPQLFQNRRPVIKPNQEPPKPRPEALRPHPRPAPKPQKQHPRPPPQPHRINMQAQKPTAIQKKPVVPDFNPSPQEGSMLANAFQPVFVASPSMDELDNDIMKPMHVVSARRSEPIPTVLPPVLMDFF